MSNEQTTSDWDEEDTFKGADLGETPPDKDTYVMSIEDNIIPQHFVESPLDRAYRELQEATGLDLKNATGAGDPRIWGSHQPILRRVLDDCIPLKEERLKVLELGMGPTSTISVFAEYVARGDVDFFSVEEGTSRKFYDVVDNVLMDEWVKGGGEGELKTWFYPQRPAGTEEEKQVESLGDTLDVIFIDGADKIEADYRRRRTWRHYAFTHNVPVIILHDADKVWAYHINQQTAGNLDNGYHALEFLSTDSPRKTATAVLWRDDCPFAEKLAEMKERLPEMHELSPAPVWKSKEFGIG